MKKGMALLLIVLGALAGAAKADFLDEFSVPQLDPRWGVYWNDTTHWSLRARPGFLRVQTKFCEAETLWNIFYYLESANGNYEASIKLIARPDSAGQVAGIFVDYDSLTRRNRAEAGFGNFSPLGKRVFGMVNDTFSAITYSDTLVYLRIRMTGNTAFTEYSPNGATWTVLRSGGPFTGHRMSGIYAMIWPALGGTRQTPHMNADFDWFHLYTRIGVETAEGRGQRAEVGITAKPNPFTAFAAVPGHEAERFDLFDIAGRKVGRYKGDRVGDGLAPGVYFLRSSESQAKPQRIVKVR